MKYRATHALHIKKNLIAQIGSEVDPNHPTFAHWMKKGYIEEVSDDMPMVGKAVNVDPNRNLKSTAITGDTKISALKNIKDSVTTVLADAGIVTVQDLDGWTEEMLMDLPGIGEATANNLLLVLSEIEE